MLRACALLIAWVALCSGKVNLLVEHEGEDHLAELCSRFECAHVYKHAVKAAVVRVGSQEESDALHDFKRGRGVHQDVHFKIGLDQVFTTQNQADGGTFGQGGGDFAYPQYVTEGGADNGSSTAPLTDLVQIQPTLQFVYRQTGAPWHVDRMDQLSSDLDGIYEYPANGTGVNLYILDSGIADHNDLTMYSAAGTTSRINRTLGANLLEGINIPSGQVGNMSTSDFLGHGTHCAGVAGGLIYGVAKAVTLVPVVVISQSGSSPISTLIKGIDWVIANATRPGVVSMSFGGAANQLLTDATNSLYANNWAVIVSAGNFAVNACTMSPANAVNAYTVGAIDQRSLQWSGSNFGNCVRSWAPGVSISGPNWPYPFSLITMTGTSFSAPIVAGMACNYMSVNTNASAAAVYAWLDSRRRPTAAGLLINVNQITV